MNVIRLKIMVRTFMLSLLLSNLSSAQDTSSKHEVPTSEVEHYSVNIKNITMYNYLELISKIGHRIIVLEVALPELRLKENPQDEVTLEALVLIANVYLKQEDLEMLLQNNVYYVRSVKPTTSLTKPARPTYIFPLKAEDSMQLYNVSPTLGIQITSVLNGGSYSEMGFQQGDIIVGVNAKRFEDVATIQQKFTHAFQNDKEFCLDILRGGAFIEHCYGE